MLLARKCARAKWAPKAYHSSSEIPSDAVADLKSSENTLSFWTIADASDEELKKTALALAAAGDRIDSLDVVWVAERDLLSGGLTIERTDGATPVVSLRSRHVDICHLDLNRHTTVVRLVAAAIKNENIKRLSKKEVVAILVAAVRDGDLDPQQLKQSIKDELAKALEKAEGP